MKNITLLLIVSFLLSSTIKGQQLEQESKLGTWTIYNGFFNFSPKFQLFLEGHWRTYEAFQNNETFLFRPYFNYRFNPNHLVGVSTEYLANYSYAEPKVLVNELRIGLQDIFSYKWGKIAVQHRVRYEFRIFDNIRNAQRIRYRLQFAVPLNKNGFKKGGLIFIINDEIFFGTYPDLNYNQNRFYTSLGYNITDHLNLQVGYQNWDRRDGNYHRIHVWLTQVIDFY